MQIQLVDSSINLIESPFKLQDTQPERQNQVAPSILKRIPIFLIKSALFTNYFSKQRNQVDTNDDNKIQESQFQRRDIQYVQLVEIGYHSFQFIMQSIRSLRERQYQSQNIRQLIILSKQSKYIESKMDFRDLQNLQYQEKMIQKGISNSLISSQRNYLEDRFNKKTYLQTFQKVELSQEQNQDCKIMRQIRDNQSNQQYEQYQSKKNRTFCKVQDYSSNQFMRAGQITSQQKTKFTKQGLNEKYNKLKYNKNLCFNDKMNNCQLQYLNIKKALFNNNISQVQRQKLLNLKRQENFYKLSKKLVHIIYRQSNEQNLDKILGGGGSCFSKGKVFSAEPVSKKENQDEKQLLNEKDNSNMKSQNQSYVTGKQKDEQQEQFIMQQIDNEQKQSQISNQDNQKQNSQEQIKETVNKQEVSDQSPYIQSSENNQQGDENQTLKQTFQQNEEPNSNNQYYQSQLQDQQYKQEDNFQNEEDFKENNQYQQPGQEKQEHQQDYSQKGESQCKTHDQSSFKDSYQQKQQKQEQVQSQVNSQINSPEKNKSKELQQQKQQSTNIKEEQKVNSQVFLSQKNEQKEQQYKQQQNTNVNQGQKVSSSVFSFEKNYQKQQQASSKKKVKSQVFSSEKDKSQKQQFELTKNVVEESKVKPNITSQKDKQTDKQKQEQTQQNSNIKEQPKMKPQVQSSQKDDQQKQKSSTIIVKEEPKVKPQVEKNQQTQDQQNQKQTNNVALEQPKVQVQNQEKDKQNNDQQIQKQQNTVTKEESKERPQVQPCLKDKQNKEQPKQQQATNKKEAPQIKPKSPDQNKEQAQSNDNEQNNQKPQVQPTQSNQLKEEQKDQQKSNAEEQQKKVEDQSSKNNKQEEVSKKEEQQKQEQNKNKIEEQKVKIPEVQLTEKQKQQQEKLREQQMQLITSKKEELMKQFQVKSSQKNESEEDEDVFSKFNKSYLEYFNNKYVNEKVLETDLRLITEETLYRYREQIVQLEIRHKVVDIINLLINYLLIIKQNDVKQSLQSDIDLITSILEKLQQYCKENREKYPCLDLYQYINILISINSQRKSLDRSNQSVAYQVLQKMIQVAKFGAGFVSITGAIKNLSDISFDNIKSFINEVKLIINKITEGTTLVNAINIAQKAYEDYSSSDIVKNLHAFWFKRINIMEEDLVQNNPISEIIFYLEEVINIKHNDTLLFVYLQINYLMSKQQLKDNLMQLSYKLVEQNKLGLVINLAYFLQVKEYSDSILDKLKNIASLIAQNHQFRFVKAQLLLYFAQILKNVSIENQLPADIMNSVVSNYLQEKQKSVKIVYEGNQIMAEYIHNQIDKKEILIEINQLKRQMTKHLDDKKQYNEFANEIKTVNDIDKQLAKFFVQMWEKSVKQRQQKLQITHKDDVLLEAVNLYIKQQITYQDGYQIDTQERDAVKQIINQFLIPNFTLPLPDIIETLDQESQSEQVEQEEVQQKLNNFPCKIISILADGGSGKSMLLKKLEVELLNRNSEYTQDSKSDYIPFIIKCNSLDKEKPSIENYLESIKISKDDIQRLKESERNKLIMLDGFDEYSGNYFKVFQELKIFEWVNTVVIVTSRLEKISVQDAKKYFNYYEKDGNEGQEDSYSVLKLQKMELEDIKEYLGNFKKQIEQDKSNNFNQDQYNKFQQIIFNNKQLIQLLKLPINLFLTTRMAMDLDLNDKNILSVFQTATDQLEIQELFFQQQFKKQSQNFIEKQLKKSSNQKQELIEMVQSCYFEYFQYIAMQMFLLKGQKSNYLTAQKDTIKYQVREEVSSSFQQNDLKTEELIQVLGKYVDSKVITRIYLTLEDDGQSNQVKISDSSSEFEFRHKSLFEYFAARAMKHDFDLHQENIHKLDNYKLKNFNINKKIIMSNKMNASEQQILLKFFKFIQPYLNSQIFKQSYSQSEISQTNRFIQYLKKSQVQNSNEKSEIDIGSSNLLSALFMSRFSFTNLNFKKCSFSQAYLPFFSQKLMQFENCNLENSFIEERHLEHFEISNTKNVMHTSFQKQFDSDDIYSFNKVIIYNNTLISISNTGFLNQFEIKTNLKQISFSNKLYSSQLINGPLKTIEYINGKNIFVVTSEKVIFEINVQTFQIRSSYKFQYKITSFQVHKQKYIVTLANNSIYIGEIQMGFQMLDKNKIQADICLFTDNTIIISQGLEIKVYNQKDLSFIASIEVSNKLSVYCISNGGKYLIISPSDSSFQIYNLQQDCELVNTVYEHTNSITTINFSPDSKYLATGSEDKTCKIWNVEREFELVKSISESTQQITSAVFSSDGKYLATSSLGKRSNIFNIQKGYELLQSIKMHSFGITSVAFSSDGKFIATGSEDGFYTIWSVEKRFELVKEIEGHEEQISQLSFSGDGKYLATGSYDKTCKIWNVKKGYELVTTILLPKSVNCVAFSPDCKNLATGSDEKTCKIWSEQNGFKLVTTLKGHSDHLRSVAFSADGKYLATGSEDKTCKIWNNQKAYQLISTLEGHELCITSVAFSRNGKYLATGSSDSTFKIWNAERAFQLMYTIGEISDEIVYNEIFSIAFSKDCKYLATGSKDKTCKIYNVEQGFQLLNSIQVHTKIITSVTFSQDGKYLATGSEDQTYKIWDVTKGFETINKTQGHNSSINSVAFSSDNKYLATASSDNTFKVWSAEKGFDIINSIEGHNKSIILITFSPDVKYLATGSEDKTCKIWNVMKGFELITTIQGHQKNINSIAFSPNSKYFVTAAIDNTCKVWNCEKGFELANTIQGKTLNQNQVAFSADGQYLAVGPLDNSCKIFNVQKGFELFHEIKKKNIIFKLVFSQDGKYFALCGYSFTIFNVQKGFQQITSIQEETINFAFSPDSKYFSINTNEGYWQIWKIDKEFQLINNVYGHKYYVKSLNFSNDGKYIATGSSDCTCKIWNVQKSFQLIDTFLCNSNSIVSIAYSSDGKYFAAKYKDNSSKIYNLESGFELVNSVQGKPNQIALDSFKFEKVEQGFNLLNLFKNDRIIDQLYEI